MCVCVGGGGGGGEGVNLRFDHDLKTSNILCFRRK